MERIHKIIAASGLTSRRKAEEMVKAGEVAVNGTVITELGHLVDPETDKITVRGAGLPKPKDHTYLLYKPRGVVTSMARQNKNERIIADLVANDTSLYPVGRLDKESEGLILVTNNGTLTHKLTHPSFEHAKEYIVTAKFQTGKTKLTAAEIEKKLRAGVKLGDGVARADTVTITAMEPLVAMVITVHEGRHHLIRRMCATLGLDVSRLIRTKIGPIEDKKLTPGTFRLLSKRELQLLSE